MGRQGKYHHGDLRAALVEAALELVAEKGVAGVSVVEAARRAGVSPAAPYRHFPSRAALLSAVAAEAGRRLSAQMAEVAEHARDGDPDPLGQAVEALAASAAVYVRYTLAHGAAFELIFADELRDFPDDERRDVTRAMFDHLLWPAIVITGDVMAANPLLRGFTAVVHGYAHLPRHGSTNRFPVDMRGFATEAELVADEAARAVRTLALAAAKRTPVDG